MVIDLDNGLETNARLNLPIIGDGPYPAVFSTWLWNDGYE